MGRLPRQLKPTPWHLLPFVLCLLWSVGSNHALCGTDKTSLFFLLSWQPSAQPSLCPGLAHKRLSVEVWELVGCFGCIPWALAASNCLPYSGPPFWGSGSISIAVAL